MNRVLCLIRTRISHKPQAFLLVNTFRAPKGGKQDAPQGATTDYICIFKDRSEPPIRPIQEYPDWLISLLYPSPSVLNIGEIWKSGEKHLYPKPTTNEVLRILHQLQKLKITEMNKYRVIKNADLLKKEIPGHRREDMYDILEGERKAQRDQEEEEEEEDEDEEEEAPRRKPPVGFEVEKESDKTPPAGIIKAKAGGKKK